MEDTLMKTSDKWRLNSLALAIGAAFSTGHGIALAQTTAPAATPVTSCASLATMAFPQTTITDTQVVGPGSTPIPGTTAPGTTSPVFGAATVNLPVQICRVRGTIKPTSVSNIIFEVWLPVSTWNGKFNGVGNGGSGGSLGVNSMTTDLGRGYATAVTDTGHQSNDSSFGLVPDLIEDFAHRAYHLTTVVGKQITTAYYGQAPTYSYFTGCSTGGAEALSEAEFYPTDYDGITAGAPANHYTLMWPGEVWPSWASIPDPAGMKTKLPALNAAAVAACDLTDGVKDGIVSDPRKCSWDPVNMQCPTGTDNTSCLTPTQVNIARLIYSGLRDPVTQQQIWPPYLLGSEDQWTGHITQGQALGVVQTGNPPVGYHAYFLYDNPTFSYTLPTFNQQSVQTINELYAGDVKYQPSLDSINPDLRPFGTMNGNRKLIWYQGWKDQNISPLNSIVFYSQVVAKLAGYPYGFPSTITEQSPIYKAALSKTQNFARLFMVPGMQHCNGGPGPATFDYLTALEQWVEQGIAPTQMLGSHTTAGVVDLTRPNCMYPNVANYSGSGDYHLAANWTCGPAPACVGANCATSVQAACENGVHQDSVPGYVCAPAASE
jgi:feruloyl esterase